MPKTEVVIYAEQDGASPLLDWMDRIPKKAQDKCFVKIERLSGMGHELRRPEADFLRDGIYELRATNKRIHYRILYFFSEGVAVLSHGLIKERSVPPKEIDLAIQRKKRFSGDPSQYTYRE